MAKDGEKQSHIDFSAKLKPLRNKGVKIFVIPGNHDVNIDKPVRYQGNKTFDTESTSDKDFKEIYADYGYKQAIDHHSESLSYAAELDDSTLLIALDVSSYNPATGRPASNGAVSENMKEWIKATIDTYQNTQNKKRVIAMMHWGVVEHLPMQSMFLSRYLVNDHQEIASFLADNGINMIFTGHFHSNDISAFTSDQGNTIYDIETGTLSSYPFSYRIVELDQNKAKIETRNISSSPSYPTLVEESKLLLKRLATQQALNMLQSKKKLISENFSKEDLNTLADIAGEMFLLHLYGDEVVPDSMKQTIKVIFNKNDFPIEDESDILNIDFPPMDNNLIIEFNTK